MGQFTGSMLRRHNLIDYSKDPYEIDTMNSFLLMGKWKFESLPTATADEGASGTLRAVITVQQGLPTPMLRPFLHTHLLSARRRVSGRTTDSKCGPAHAQMVTAKTKTNQGGTRVNGWRRAATSGWVTHKDASEKLTFKLRFACCKGNELRR